MSNERPIENDPARYQPEDMPAAPPMPPPSCPEADGPRDYDTDTAGGGGKMPLPKEGEGDPRERKP